MLRLHFDILAPSQPASKTEPEPFVEMQNLRVTPSFFRPISRHVFIATHPYLVMHSIFCCRSIRFHSPLYPFYRTDIQYPIQTKKPSNHHWKGSNLIRFWAQIFEPSSACAIAKSNRVALSWCLLISALLGHVYWRWNWVTHIWPPDLGRRN